MEGNRFVHLSFQQKKAERLTAILRANISIVLTFHHNERTGSTFFHSSFLLSPSLFIIPFIPGINIAPTRLGMLAYTQCN